MLEEKRKILIIDDDQVMLDVTAAGLELDGFEVITAPNGKLGVQKVSTLSPDVVLLDLRLPDLDGFEVLRQIRALPNSSEIHVIMITGDMTIDIDKAFAFGADDCIIKPIDMRFLVSRIGKLIKKRYKVLVVEDDRQISDILTSILEKQSYAVNVLHDGLNILEEVKSFKPDMILLDISLPVGPDGTQLCRIIKSDPAVKSLPVMMITANEQTDLVEKCFTYGAEDYVFKPFSIPDLLFKIRKYLRISGREQ